MNMRNWDFNRIKGIIAKGVVAALSLMALVPVGRVGSAEAASVTVGLIESYLVNANEVFAFRLNVTTSGKPACNTGNRFAINPGTAAGVAVKDAILNAQSNQLIVQAVGTGQCTTWSDSEDLLSLTVQDPSLSAREPQLQSQGTTTR